MNVEIENKIREYMRYDPDTGKVFWIKVPRYAISVGSEVGSLLRHRTRYYRQTTISGARLWLHRIAWFLYYGSWPKNQIDHIDGDGLNNRIENMRDVTNRVNHFNMKVHRDGRLLGAHYSGGSKKNPWRSEIYVNGKKIYLGLFSIAQDAHAAYIRAFEQL